MVETGSISEEGEGFGAEEENKFRSLIGGGEAKP
jgi:hypothetical protein